MKSVCFSMAAMDDFPQQNASYAGGNSLNQAIQFREQGMEASFVGAIGTDEAGDRISDLLRKASVDVSRLRRLEGSTASNQIINDESGERFGVDGKWDSGVYDLFRLNEEDWKFVAECDLVATHANCPDYRAMLNHVSVDQFVAVDFLHLDDFELMKQSAGVVDVIFSGGREDMIDDLWKVAKETGILVVLTLGADGSLAFLGNIVIHQDALPLGKVVDTTGCGDAFQAAFTGEYFQSKDLKDSLLKGAEAGRVVAQRYGAAQWL